MAEENEEDLGSLISFSEDIAEAEEPDLLPPGVYPAEIKSAAPARSQKGNIYAKVLLVVKPDDFPADYDRNNAPDGKNLSYNRITFKDDIPGRYALKMFCEAIGAPMPRKGEQYDLTSWQGLQCKVQITHGSYEGRKREEVAKVMKL